MFTPTINHTRWNLHKCRTLWSPTQLNQTSEDSWEFFKEDMMGRKNSLPAVHESEQKDWLFAKLLQLPVPLHDRHPQADKGVDQPGWAWKLHPCLWLWCCHLSYSPHPSLPSSSTLHNQVHLPPRQATAHTQTGSATSPLNGHHNHLNAKTSYNSEVWVSMFHHREGCLMTVRVGIHI